MVLRQYERSGYAEKSIYCRDINSSLDILPSYNCVLGCFVNYIKITITKEEIAN